MMSGTAPSPSPDDAATDEGIAGPLSSVAPGGVGLLVSVRDVGEALDAAAGGADVVDLKEPAHGALGATSPATWREVSRALVAGPPLSAALGELRDWTAGASSRPAAPARSLDSPTSEPCCDAPAGNLWRQRLEVCAEARLRFVKFAFAGAGADWRRHAMALLGSLPVGVLGVLAAYADHTAAQAPRPEEVLEAAVECGARGVLVDTFVKGRGDLFAAIDAGRLERLVSDAHGAGLGMALAGSLDGVALERAAALGPDLIGVRGAVCHGDRGGRLSRDAVAQVAARVRLASQGTRPNAAAVRRVPIAHSPPFA